VLKEEVEFRVWQAAATHEHRAPSPKNYDGHSGSAYEGGEGDVSKHQNERWHAYRGNREIFGLSLTGIL